MSWNVNCCKCLILNQNENQAPQVKTSKNGNTNWLEFNLLVQKTNKNDKDKKDYNFVAKVMCFNENISNLFLNNFDENKNNFFTGRISLQSNYTEQFEKDGKKHNYHKYFTYALNDFDFIITQTEKQNHEPQKGWKTEQQQDNSTEKQNITTDAVVDDDIPF